jgi:esterase/lipase superfamily enzyme
MRREYHCLYSPAVGRDMEFVVYGHYGAPIIAFPSGGGRFYDFENNGMITAVGHLLEAGKIKIYCPDGLDHESWLNTGLDIHWRGVRHNAYEDFIQYDLVRWIRDDCHDHSLRVALAGCSLGAYHAANMALKHPQIFHYALCMSGRYDLNAIIHGESGSPEFYFNNPLAYLYHVHGADLDHIRYNTHLALVCGQGAWEDKCLYETNRLADILQDKGISHERDIWGHDVEHHWYWWRRQMAYHLGKTFA